MRSARIILLACIAASIIAAHATAGPADDTQLRHTLETRYAALKVAMAERNTELVRTFLAPGFASVDTLGRTKDADQMLQALAAVPARPLRAGTTTIGHIEDHGTRVTVDQQYVTTIDASAPNGHTVDVRLVASSTDTSVKISGGWFLQSTVTKHVHLSDQEITHRP